MPKNKLSDLRDHLFATLESLTDKEAPMDIARAQAVCSVAEQLIESAKVEVKYIEVMGQEDIGSEFFPSLAEKAHPSRVPRLAATNSKANGSW